MLKQRVITALVLAPLMLGGIFLLPLNEFGIFVGVIATVAAWEWANMSGITHAFGRMLYAAMVALALFATSQLLKQEPSYQSFFLAIAGGWWLLALLFVLRYPNLTSVWSSMAARSFIGFCVLIPMWVGFMYLKQSAHSSLLILYLMFLIWGADTGAYFAGKRWGKSKLAPQVSPGKSWAGFWGGLATALFVSLVFAYYCHSAIKPLDTGSFISLIVISAITMFSSVLGDLLESMFKRFRGIKDSSSLLPGHGGVMDRIDSMSAAVPVFAGLLLLFQWSLA